MNMLLAIVVGLFACWLLAHIVTTIVVIAKANPAKLKELQDLQGGLKNVVVGKLENAPAACDYRVVQGLEWNGKRFVAQSRLSTEAIRAAFFS